MITPRITRLMRVSDLQTMHRVLAEYVPSDDPLSSRSTAIVVPTGGAGESLRRTLERHVLERGGRRVAVLPDLVTRSDLYQRLHASRPGAPPLLSEFEREVLFARAARIASSAGAHAPFSLRPGLILEILAFYDELRRRDRSVEDFARLMTDSLAPTVDVDRGAERMLRQTDFLVAAFREFERSVDASGSIDEHGLRRLLVDEHGPCAYRHIVIAVADQAADALGLWTSDYDLLARIPGLECLDIVATENVLASGFHQRIHDLLPGLEEMKHGNPVSVDAPVLVAPASVESNRSTSAQPPPHWFTCRDREEELADVARRTRCRTTAGRIGVAFQRPLPYLYLAKTVFADATVAYQAVDALPLAAEPFAAAVDLVFTFITSEATRASIVELLGSPHWRFASASGVPVTRDDVAALDALLRERKYVGGWERLAALAAEIDAGGDLRRRRRVQGHAALALEAAAGVAERLRRVAQIESAAGQISHILEFVRDHEQLPDETDTWSAHHLRARGAIIGALESLAVAHARHDPAPLRIAELSGTVRRWIEAQTFSPRTGSIGVMLLDAPGATFADLDELRIVGLVERDWPDRGRRNIFYPVSLLTQLGWPTEAERLAAARARFHDLLHLPREQVSVSTFTLEDDGIVSGSLLLEELEASGLRVERPSFDSAPRVFTHELLWESPPLPFGAANPLSEWIALRTARTSPDTLLFRGFTGAYHPQAHAVSHVERYLDCPFKYFASYVLQVDEERDEESGLTPQERGQFLHELFERFFAAWHESGRQGITAANLADALLLFEEIAESRLATLSETDRALERTYLLGSAAAAGLAERAFAFEIEHGVNVVERLLEYPLEGEFAFQGEDGPRHLRIRAKADRIDLLEDGTLRIVDYKLGRAPKPARALQLAIYGICAEQHLSERLGEAWTVSRAGYVAFREKNAFVPLGGSSPLSEALADGQRRLLSAVSAIERGDFPPRPEEPFFCTRCGYASVCRKDYVGDE